MISPPLAPTGKKNMDFRKSLQKWQTIEQNIDKPAKSGIISDR